MSVDYENHVKELKNTILILDYISNESLRRRISEKGETMNGLASALFLGNEGNWDGNILIFLEYTPLI
ncbi:Tn3 family transposase [Bacillus paralicheniformis]|nr:MULTISPECIES: Tn3 family transposase [Bacillus]MDN5388028.1 Tn3 family transposase [Bacillus sp. LB7]MEC1021294.1 Tn3 family transposase [Bacillus paralicheniformis]MEC1028176.1 Tn3 family transposase [Bacillus paralicheniformis]MEC1034920.1 Tn3 family transposase [Bacillus paralicheniformis]MEC1049928.1 Tn3 family transposase [Bacillus paralicheniformis]